MNARKARRASTEGERDGARVEGSDAPQHGEARNKSHGIIDLKVWLNVDEVCEIAEEGQRPWQTLLNFF